jgi:Arc/MetJ-type ribon-helix-helix transcriptional regulator
MTKDTVRYPDSLVEDIEALVDDGAFESKSEFYRFSAEYVLNLLDPDRDETTFSYRELTAELDIDDGAVPGLDADGGLPFLRAVVRVRQLGLRGEYDAAEEFIDANYEPTDRESLLLDELLGAYRGDDPPRRARSGRE